MPGVTLLVELEVSFWMHPNQFPHLTDGETEAGNAEGTFPPKLGRSSPQNTPTSPHSQTGSLLPLTIYFAKEEMELREVDYLQIAQLLNARSKRRTMPR